MKTRSPVLLASLLAVDPGLIGSFARCVGRRSARASTGEPPSLW